MKILEAGKRRGEKECDWTCKWCHAVIRSKISEGVLKYDDEGGDVVEFGCPSCGWKNWIATSLFK